MDLPNLSLFLIMICFWITLWLVYRYLIGPVGRVMEDRKRRIDDAGAEWESTNSEYVAATERLEREMEEAARDAARIRGELRQQALTSRQQTLESARATADGRLRGALDEVTADVESARGELRKRADALARLFATRLLGREAGS